MSIKILFFGATAAIVGERQLLREEAGSTASHLRKQIIADHPQLGAHDLLIAINQKYAAADDIVNDGDEVAIFTAVSGG